MSLLLLLAACRVPTAEPDRAPIPPLRIDGAVLISAVIRSPAPIPPRFSTPVERWFEDPDPPPAGRIRHALCSGRPGAREALLESGPVDERLVPLCRDPGWCRWLEGALDSGRQDLWWATSACPGPEITRRVDRSGPPEVALDRAAERRGWDPRLEPLVLRLAERPGNGFERGLEVLAAIDDPAAEAALLSLHQRVPRARRDEVALSLWGRPSERAEALFREVCLRVEDLRCGLVRPDPLAALPDALLAGEEAPEGLFERWPHHRAAVTSALRSCAEAGSRRCLVALAREDRAAAAELAADQPGMTDLAKVLRADRQEVLEALQELGLSPLPVPDGSEAVTVPELLEAAGRAVPIEEWLLWEPYQIQLLYTLASAAGAPDLEFDALLPSLDAPKAPGRTPAISLYAWADGWRWRALSVETGVWEPPLAVGLLNAVLIARGSASRLALDHDRTRVLIGTAESLAALEEQGWVPLYRPPPPEEGYLVTPIGGDPVFLEPVGTE